MIRLFVLLDECSYQLAAKLTSPDPNLQLRLVKVLHVVSNEPVEQVTDQGLEHHDFSPPAVTRWRVAFSPRRISALAICDRVSLGSITVASCRERASIGQVTPLILPPFTFTSYRWYKARYEEINKETDAVTVEPGDVREFGFVTTRLSSPSSVHKWSKPGDDKNHILKRFVAPVTTSWWLS